MITLTERGMGGGLESLRVVVDGVGPLVGWISVALRSCGFARVSSGAYAVEQLRWQPPQSPRRDHRLRPPEAFEDVGAIVAVRSGRVEPQSFAPWQHHGLLHLPVEVHPGVIQVGPLVVPGVSACLACRPRSATLVGAEPIHRASQSPASMTEPDPGGGVLVAALTALTIRQAVLGDHSLAGVSCEIAGSRPEVVHRYWALDPHCHCRDRRDRSA